MLSLSECIPWMTVGLVESVAIVTLNLCTIIVFIRNSNLRKRSTYLVINLAVIDMLGGGVAVYALFYWFGEICNVWKWHLAVHLEVHLANRILRSLFLFFPGMSLVNLSIIALERAYATFWPLRYRVLKKWVHGVVIAFVWVTYGLILIASVLLEYLEEGVHNLYLKIAFGLFCILIICVSYTCIVIKVRCAAQPRHHGAASRERKLTMTLLIVTVVSLLSCLPAIMFSILLYSGKFEMSFSVAFNINSALWVSVYANCLANPIFYAIRMPEFRSAVAALFCRQPTLRNRERPDFPLRAM